MTGRAVALVVAVIAAVAACLRGDTGFHCNTDSVCGAGGTCAQGYCAFPDSTCTSGQRYGASSGPFANQCVVAGDAAIDAIVDAPPGSPMLVTSAHGHGSNGSAFDVQLTIANTGTKHLLVGVISVVNPTGVIGGGTDPAPTLSWVCPAGSTTLVIAADIKDSTTHTRTQIWQHNFPTTGVVCKLHAALTSNYDHIHLGALSFVDVNQAAPIANGMTATGTTSPASDSLASSGTNIVVTTIGASGAITAHGTNQTLVYTDNVSAATLDNTSVTTSVGAATVAQSFDVGSGLWQIASVSLQP